MNSKRKKSSSFPNSMYLNHKIANNHDDTAILFTDYFNI